LVPVCPRRPNFQSNPISFARKRLRPPSGGLFVWLAWVLHRVSGAARKFYRSPQSRGLADEAPAGAARSGVCRRCLGGGPRPFSFGQLK
jgi:hypothetical protein